MKRQPALVDIDLSNCSVFLDFDGTVSTHDVSGHLLSRLADGDWRRSYERLDRGEIGSRLALLEQWAMLPDDRLLLEEVASEVALDPEFPQLVLDLARAGCEVSVVSDGFGFYVESACAGLPVTVITNCPVGRRLDFPYASTTCPCGLCGTCKLEPIRRAARSGRQTVCVGDGRSDLEAARAADVVFAKGLLAERCREDGVAFVPFSVLADVHLAFFGL